MSRLESGALQLKKDWHELNDLVGVVLETHKLVLSHHRIITALAENLPLVRVDFRLFEQALSNLILNAATYSPDGTTIEISGRKSGELVELAVADSGPGIPEDSQARLFDKFYRVPGSPTGGTGIGLAIARSIVESHSGTIEVRNRATGGACFMIRLPIERQPQTPPREKESS